METPRHESFDSSTSMAIRVAVMAFVSEPTCSLSFTVIGSGDPAFRAPTAPAAVSPWLVTIPATRPGTLFFSRIGSSSASIVLSDVTGDSGPAAMVGAAVRNVHHAANAQQRSRFGELAMTFL
jgi:hypothetical protein